jgi:hypothetical protein
MLVREHLQDLQKIKAASARAEFLGKLAKALYLEGVNANLTKSEILTFIGHFIECINDDLRGLPSNSESEKEFNQDNVSAPPSRNS